MGMSDVAALLGVMGAVGVGCAIGERRRRAALRCPERETFRRRQRRVLVGAVLLPIYPVLSSQFYGLALLGTACTLLLLGLANRSIFRAAALVTAILTGVVGLAFLLPFFWIAAPLLLQAGCALSARRISDPTSSTVERRITRRSDPSVPLLAAAELVVLGLGLTVALAARPG
jgi:hypothetical protein